VLEEVGLVHPLFRPEVALVAALVALPIFEPRLVQDQRKVTFLRTQQPHLQPLMLEAVYSAATLLQHLLLD